MVTIVCFLCAGMFAFIGVWSLKQTDPVRFYAGISVKPESIRDVPAYNRDCGRMWILYSLIWFCLGCAALWLGTSMAMFWLILAAALLGSIGLLLAFQRILKTHTK